MSHPNAAPSFIIQIVEGVLKRGMDDMSDESDEDDDYESEDENDATKDHVQDGSARRIVTRSMSREKNNRPVIKTTARERTKKSKHDDGAHQNVAAQHYTREERAYYVKLDKTTQQRVAITESMMHRLNEYDVPLRFKVLLSEVNDKVKAIAVRKVNMLYELDASSSEYHKVMNWVDALCRLPIGKYCALPVHMDSSARDKQAFLVRAKEEMSKSVYGHERAKEQILRLIAQWICNPASKGMVIGIHGCHGCGKTTLVKDGICRVLGLPFAMVPLGGASDASFLEGHSYTYEGSTWGKVVDVLMKAGCSNPVLYFDELDKVSESHRGDEIINKLIHITDSTQNTQFSDKFFYDIDLDLSRCLIIFSFNNVELVNPILKDRMIQIKTHGYNVKDKQRIAMDYLLPALLSEFNMDCKDIVFSNAMIDYIVQYIDEEEGVRNLKRAMHEIVSSINLQRLLDADAVSLPPVHVTHTHVHDYIKTSVRHANESHRYPMHMYM